MMTLQVRITDADKDVPLYVVIRKWVQNDPDAELMPLPAHGDDLAEAKRSLAPKLPAVPPPSEEEVHLAQQHVQESMVDREDEPASVEVSCAMNLSMYRAHPQSILRLRPVSASGMPDHRKCWKSGCSPQRQQLQRGYSSAES